MEVDDEIYQRIQGTKAKTFVILGHYEKGEEPVKVHTETLSEVIQRSSTQTIVVNEKREEIARYIIEEVIIKEKQFLIEDVKLSCIKLKLD